MKDERVGSEGGWMLVSDEITLGPPLILLPDDDIEVYEPDPEVGLIPRF